MSCVHLTVGSAASSSDWRAPWRTAWRICRSRACAPRRCTPVAMPSRRFSRPPSRRARRRRGPGHNRPKRNTETDMSEPQGVARESRHPRSAELYERACRVIPGGVSSPVRAFRAVGGTPLFIARAAGAQVFDADGRSYLDFVGSWGPLIAGHAHPAVVAAVTEALARGTTYGAPCAAEVELAERVVAAYPAVEQARFVSSGTEAVMS